MSKYDIPKSKGYYVLFINVGKACRITTRSGKKFNIKPGIYVYLGSAFGRGGLYSRIMRHLRKRKKLFWHIDYLLTCKQVEIIEYLTIECSKNKCIDYESFISRTLTNMFEPIKGFGCSDKPKDTSHLFYCGRSMHRCKSLIEKILANTNSKL
ncbi:protein of unknown function DUF123 [Staphylothermus marinus F1]|uniref:GIY-YIG nuclease family protein n=1 Tax=Staphylothermus marinus (strain ATCC 43588 / DSM 3639 / JCM 9404 / F1) TaxID=399550 RepID=A3DPE8_STAMF|nr:GIY-YIG nuclease family protein [Staphylothermus marinus]ABN70508.1 protein of unknown function DUF123 [Staphylothermus marinus F1]